MMGNLGDFSPVQDGIRQEAAFVSLHLKNNLGGIVYANN